MWFAESELKAYDEESEEPEMPNPVFKVGDKVYVNVNESAIDEDDKEWYVGVIVGYEESTNIYIVDVKEADDVTYTFNVRPDQLKPYTENEVPPLPEDAKFAYGDRVVVNGEFGTVIGYDFSERKYGVLLDSDDEEPKWYAEDALAPYAEPENPEEDGGTDTPDAGE